LFQAEGTDKLALQPSHFGEAVQFRLIISVFVFLGSYLPLSVILLAENFQYDALKKPLCHARWTQDCFLPLNNPGLSLSIFALCAFCLLVTLAALSVIRPDKKIIIEQATHVPADLMNYTLPYVVSFMSVNYQQTAPFVGFLIFLAWMFLITHRSGQTLLNPVLIVFGWRPYQVDYRFGGDQITHSGLALVRGHIAPTESHLEAPVQDILIIKPKTGK
jgi:hypothetical protein